MVYSFLIILKSDYLFCITIIILVGDQQMTGGLWTGPGTPPCGPSSGIYTVDGPKRKKCSRSKSLMNILIKIVHFYFFISFTSVYICLSLAYFVFFILFRGKPALFNFESRIALLQRTKDNFIILIYFKQRFKNGVFSAKLQILHLFNI